MKKSFVEFAVFAALITCVALPGEVRANTTTTTSVEERVREFFADAPVMIEIARCESKFRQFTDAGNPLRGGYGGGMIGVFQLYERVHAGDAKILGFDLTTLEGNMGYAKHLYTLSGTTPWNSAKACWDVPTVSDAAASDVSKDTAILLAEIKRLTKLIAELQKMLETRKLVVR